MTRPRLERSAVSAVILLYPFMVAVTQFVDTSSVLASSFTAWWNSPPSVSDVPSDGVYQPREQEFSLVSGRLAVEHFPDCS